jgi:hypothetical protein
VLELLEWGKKRDEAEAGPAADLDASEPSVALAELAARLDAHGDGRGSAQAHNAALALIQDAGAPHVAAMLARCYAGIVGTLAAREVTWKSLADYQSRLTRELCAGGGALLTAQSGARALSACRTLAKIHLVHYESVPGTLWRAAYTIHAAAEQARCATTPVHARPDARTKTTVELELLRLLMLRVSAPDMLAPEQIEIADRVVEQLGAEFTLRQPGVADNPFCFEPAGEFPPRRGKGRQPGVATRYFGPGMGYDSLKRMAKQLAAGKLEDFKAFGKDIAPGVQQSTVQHLLTFWQVDCPYSPPAHTAATGSLQVVHGYGRIWQYLSQASQAAGELALTDYSAEISRPPETWVQHGAGGNELGAQVPPEGRAWVKCGTAVGLQVGNGERFVGMIRRMHAGEDGSVQADVAVLSRAPRALSLREVIELGDDSAFSNASSRQFAAGGTNAVILADGTPGAPPANLLLPPGQWKEGRLYEAQDEGATRLLRVLQAVRRGDDYVRATFEWVSDADVN